MLALADSELLTHGAFAAKEAPLVELANGVRLEGRLQAARACAAKERVLYRTANARLRVTVAPVVTA